MYSHRVDTYELNNNSAVLEGCRGLYEEVLLQIDSGADEFEITMSGALKNGLPLHSLAVIDMNNFETIECIVKGGIYLLPTKGLSHLIASASGKVDITAKFLSDRG